MRVGWRIGAGVGALTFASVVGCGGDRQGVAGDASVDGASSDRVDAFVAEDSTGSPASDAESDAGLDTTPGCTPEAVTPPPFVPPRAPRSACTDTQIETFYADCFASGAPAGSCDTFKGDPDNSPCILCVQTDSTDVAWGAVIQFSNDTVLTNVSGCVALVDQDAGPGSCAVAHEANELCLQDSCAANCPSGATSSGYQAFQQCQSLAGIGVCKQYAAAAQCDQAVRYTSCLYADFQSGFLGLGRIFCEAGRDAGGDAASDGAVE